MTNFAQRLQQINRNVECRLCGEEDQVFRCVECATCGAAFHKACVQPFRGDWPEDEEFACDECAAECVICEMPDDENDDETGSPLIICDGCELCFHVACVEESIRPRDEDIGDEDVEWFCAACIEENESDDEWASEHIVADDDMTREECFSRSQCTCEFCNDVHRAVDTWREWEPDNIMQRSMKNAIDAKEGLVNTVMYNLHMKHNLPPPR